MIKLKKKWLNAEIRLGKEVDKIWGEGVSNWEEIYRIGFIEAHIFGSCYLGMGCKCFIKSSKHEALEMFFYLDHWVAIKLIPWNVMK